MTSEDPHKRKKIRCQFCLILTHLPLSLRLSHHSSIDQLSIIVRWFYCGWFFCNVFAHCVLRVYQIFIRFFGPTSFHHRHSFCVCVSACGIAKMCKYLTSLALIKLFQSIIRFSVPSFSGRMCIGMAKKKNEVKTCRNENVQTAKHRIDFYKESVSIW